MALTLSDVNQLTLLADYLRGSGVGPLDTRVAEQLALIFGGDSNCFPCQCGPNSIQDALRDEPNRTFLRLLVCEALGSGGSEGEGGAGVPVPCPDPEIDLGTAFSYGVLAGTEITNTGVTHIYGDLGLSPGSAVTGDPVVHGESHVTDAAAAQAQLDLTAAYLDAFNRPPGTVVAGNIGGQTLSPGVYTAATSLAVSSGDLVLDGGGDPEAFWIFQIGSTFTMTTGRQIILINGANARNIFWQVGSSATLGANTVFKGTILALTATTVVTESNIEGRILVRNAAITLDSNNVVVPSNICGQ